MTFEISETSDIDTCLALRRIVFIDEQGVPEADELDGLDDTALHLMACRGGRPVGTARILTFGDTGKIGRVCVLAEARGAGIGRALVLAAVDRLAADPAIARAKLSARTDAIGFYEGLGFAAIGADYIDAGIPHRDMIRPLREPA